MIDIYLPSISQGLFRHTNDSFREIVIEWEKRGLVNVIRSNEPYIWWGKKNDILLYDRDTFMWYDKLTPKYNYILCGCDARKYENESNWIYWARHPNNLENIIIIPFEDREIESIFVGRIENNVQEHFRNNSEWNKNIELFELQIAQEGIPYKYTNIEYLNLLRYSKFGLCLRGFGPKCHREVELMACGTVPIITPEVDITNYYDPPIENIHYIKVNNSDEIREKINKITPEKWKEMSKSCIDWYKKNCSIEGSFKTTKKIIDKLQSKKNVISSISTLANKKSNFDLDLLLKSISIYHQNMNIYVACDNDIINGFDKNQYGLNIKFINCLEKYGDCDRIKMEKEHKWLDFMMEKMTAIKYALDDNPNTLFLDSDIMLLDKLPMINTKYDVILSQHHIKKNNEYKYGKFNGGYFFVSNKDFIDWFYKTTMTRSRFYEQQTLDYTHERFNVGYFSIQNNFGWWRLFECDNPDERLKKFSIIDDIICYDKLPLKSIHTHFYDPSASNTSISYMTHFNEIIIELLKKSQTSKMIYNFINNKLNETIINNIDKINIIIQTYKEENESRMNEYLLCIIKNLENNVVEKVINLYEGDNDDYLPEIILKHKKYMGVKLNKRMTFSDAFNFSNIQLNKKICAVSNLDIMLNEHFDLNELNNVLNDKTVLALSRHEIDSDGKIYVNNQFKNILHSNTQDIWIYRTPIIIDKNIDCNFAIGTIGSDNAIAERLYRANYNIYNMMNTFKVIHVDNNRSDKNMNFVKYHREKEIAQNIKNKNPEKNGQLLVPNYDDVKNISIDELLKQFKYSEKQKVMLITELFTKNIKITN